MPKKMLILSILYEEPDPRTYAGIRLSNSRMDEVHVINSGNPHKDYLKALSWYEEDTIILTSSSIDNFLLDGGDLSSDSRLVTDQEILYLFTGDPIMHNGNHDPVEAALYDQQRIKALSDADRTNLIEDRKEKGLIPILLDNNAPLRERMTIEEAIEIEKKISLLGI